MPVSTSKSNYTYMDDIFHSGLLSDVEIKAFGTSYKVHKSFKLLLRRLYCIQDAEKEKEIPAQMIATAGFFQVDEKSLLTDWKENDVSMHFAIALLNLVSGQNYGDEGTQLIKKSTNYLLENGWQAGYESWRGIKPSLIAEIVNTQEFFVPNEFEKIMFSVRILRDLTADEDEIELAIKRFRQDFSFFTLTYGQQRVLLSQELRNGKRVFGLSSFSKAALITSVAHYSGVLYKSSPIPTYSLQISQLKYYYRDNTSDLSLDGSTSIPSFRFSTVLDVKLSKELLS
ncbi:unnamed protein product [Ambrosiozyma monospora]|uniref:Unnamed protein product n=1 Tax=Ambrosiozyma monospora TaxID=43982 RepID=A0ACB5SVG8_AMBMO|nr:unnamed protein product [Ambrosiozyma monospora]